VRSAPKKKTKANRGDIPSESGKVPYSGCRIKLDAYVPTDCTALLSLTICASPYGTVRHGCASAVSHAAEGSAPLQHNSDGRQRPLPTCGQLEWFVMHQWFFSEFQGRDQSSFGEEKKG
jgi:hypothetical protein